MKLILCLSALLLLFTAPAFSELTVDDLEKIQAIVNESKKELKEDIAASEQRMREYISYEIGKVNIKMEEMDKRLTNDIKALEVSQTRDFETLGERLDHIFLLVLALVAFVGVVVGVPQIIVARQRKDMRVQDEKIEAQQKQIEALLQEMDTLKQERIVRP